MDDPVNPAPAAMPVPPDAVRVWRGYRLAGVPSETFLGNLGSTFIPITVQMQRLYGLTAYLPAVLPVDKPAGVPDEVALVFYATQASYTQATQHAGGRAYSMLHATLFDLQRSHSGFPLPLPPVLATETPYHLFDDAVDWQSGHTLLLAASRRSATDPALFAHQVQQWCQAQQASRPAGLDGAIVLIGNDYLLCWEHWASRAAAQSSALVRLAEAGAVELMAPYSAVAVQPALAVEWSGLAVSGGECFNTQFPRLSGR